MDQNKDGLKTTNPLAGLPGAVFENAWELRWGVKLLYVCLFVDALVAYGLHVNLRGVALDMSWVWDHLGAIFEAFVLFCILVSFVVPVAAGFTRLVGVFAPWHLLSNPEYSLEHGCVLFSDMRDHCLHNSDEFAWKIYNEAEDRDSRWAQKRHQVGVLAFGLVAFFLANAWAGFRFGVPTLGYELASAMDISGALLLGLAFIAVLHWAWWESQPPRQIYYPPLAEKLRVKRNLARASVYSTTSEQE